MVVLLDMMVPVGLLGVLSMGAFLVHPRLHLIAGAFWIIISLLSLSQWGLIYALAGLVVGASHLAVLGQETLRARSRGAVR